MLNNINFKVTCLQWHDVFKLANLKSASNVSFDYNICNNDMNENNTILKIQSKLKICISHDNSYNRLGTHSSGTV